MKNLKIVFVTGTRADYGKLKSLMKICDQDNEIDMHVYVTGMHLLDEYGYTYNEVVKDGYKNIHKPECQIFSEKMDENIAYTILNFSKFIRKYNPQFIIIHGDRIEPLAAAIVGILNNIRVVHIEGGEITGTVDEFIRHSVSKLSSLHLVANNEARFRLIQLGEKNESIHIIGSPDIDIMLSDKLPSIGKVKMKYNIIFEKYGIFIYHPVTTCSNLEDAVQEVISAIIKSNKNYIIIYPNNDHGSNIICKKIKALEQYNRFVIFKSLPFEEFLVLLKHSEFIIGNSSAGVREACVYGIPAIDIGNRQNKRYLPSVLKNVQHVEENEQEILNCISNVKNYQYKSNYFGDGHSAEKFISIIKQASNLKDDVQKVFVEMDATTKSIQNYINEVCF